MDADLVALAESCGVATWYEDWQRRRKEVAAESVVAVLDLLGVDASTPAAIRQALAERREYAKGGHLPATLVVREGTARALPRPGTIRLEDGSIRQARSIHETDSTSAAGTAGEAGTAGKAGTAGNAGTAGKAGTAGEARVAGEAGEIPADLPLGWHQLQVDDQDITLVVVPAALPEPPVTWGWMLQLYALHSDDSWGMGDLGDLRTFLPMAGHPGLVLLNPLHAVTPTLPVSASPYSPSSRRFANPLYLRVHDTPEYRRADPALRAQVDALKPKPTADGLIDYSAAWQAKRAALELLWPLAGDIDLESDPGLTDFARFCALAERYGPNWPQWPQEYRRPDSPAVRAYSTDRVSFHAWLQRLLTEQLTAANEAAKAAGMQVGVVHDLAVGIDPNGADGWLLQDVLASGVHAGAPPDAFNQLGQDWGLAAWRPDRLIETGYAAYRDMLRRIFRIAGGLRVDHVAGLWRLWWVPPGKGPAEGTYVRYDPEAMLGILALEATRAGAAVIGEDLGTVEPEVTRTLERMNMLGSAVLWFTRDWDRPEHPFIPATGYPRNALASISTHDLPTAAGFLTGEQVRVRAELGQLVGPVDEEARTAERDRAALLSLLEGEGLISASSDTDEIITAMHEFLARTPARFVTASLYDVLGELNQPNLPGTTDQYPNWRMPLGSSLKEIAEDPRIPRIAAVLARRKATDMSFLDKAKDFMDEHDEQVDQALEKAGDMVDERTDHKYTDKIDQGVNEAQKRTGDGDTQP